MVQGVRPVEILKGGGISEPDGDCFPSGVGCDCWEGLVAIIGMVAIIGVAALRPFGEVRTDTEVGQSKLVACVPVPAVAASLAVWAVRRNW